MHRRGQRGEEGAGGAKSIKRRSLQDRGVRPPDEGHPSVCDWVSGNTGAELRATGSQEMLTAEQGLTSLSQEWLEAEDENSESEDTSTDTSRREGRWLPELSAPTGRRMASARKPPHRSNHTAQPQGPEALTGPYKTIKEENTKSQKVLQKATDKHFPSSRLGLKRQRDGDVKPTGVTKQGQYRPSSPGRGTRSSASPGEEAATQRVSFRACRRHRGRHAKHTQSHSR